MVLTVYTDGGSRGNPGPASIGIVMYLNGKKVFEKHEKIGTATNNDAEYTALIRALENVNSFLSKITQIRFYSDSKLMVNQVNGTFKVKNGKIKEYILKIRMLEQGINLPILYSYIPREQNQEADRIVNDL